MIAERGAEPQAALLCAKREDATPKSTGNYPHNRIIMMSFFSDPVSYDAPVRAAPGHNTNKEKTNIDDAWISAPSEFSYSRHEKKPSKSCKINFKVL